MDHNEDIDKEIRISLSIFWDIAVQGKMRLCVIYPIPSSMTRREDGDRKLPWHRTDRVMSARVCWNAYNLLEI